MSTPVGTLPTTPVLGNFVISVNPQRGVVRMTPCLVRMARDHFALSVGESIDWRSLGRNEG